MTKIRLLFVLLSLIVAGFVLVGQPVFAASQAESTTATAIEQKIDINTADEAVLSTLPGIGEKTAAAITSYRQENGNFKSIDELEQVKGIGAKKLAKIRPYLQEI